MRLSRTLRHVAALGLALFVGASSLRAAETAASSSSANDPGTDAPQLVRRALVAEGAGDGQRRDDYLRDALAADPAYAPAHWQSGQVRVGEQWLSIADAAAKTARAGKVAQYRGMRDNSQNTVIDHLRVARWCESAGLKDQQRLHLFAAMQLKPTRNQSHEILHKLGLVRHQKVLIPAAEVEVLKEQAKASEKIMQDWKTRLRQMRDDLESRDPARQQVAREQLLAIKDPAAIGPLELVFRKAKPEVGNVAITTIAGMKQQAATDSLVRHAMFAEHDEVRQAAAEALKPRSVFSYVPTLMSAMQSQVQVEFESYYLNGQFRHRLALYQEGPAADYALLSAGSSREDDSVTYHPKSGQAPDYRVHFSPDRTVAADVARAEGELAANVVREQVNQRVAAVMRTTTGNDFNADPAQWWSWWLDFNEMYQQPYKPVVQTYVNVVQAPNTYRVQYMSCFVAGTPVQTSTGPMAIEKIKPGDCVLAQDPDSGELAYKPVMVTTVRPPSPLIDIQLGGETIRATRGHPFWVDGAGWQMAKELKAGQWLHTVSGPRLIDSAEQNGEAECFNMVVADFNTYFVGVSQVLVHDNNLRQVTVATVPGLVDP